MKIGEITTYSVNMFSLTFIVSFEVASFCFSVNLVRTASTQIQTSPDRGGGKTVNIVCVQLRVCTMVR